MKVYFAGLKEESLITDETEILLSYVNDKKGIEKLKHKKKLFVDSGAYSAFTKGIEIDIDKYINYLKENEELFGVYCVLDVIGNSVATKENLLYMESKGLKPLPVFHYKAPLDDLREMVEKYNYIGLGGLVPLAKRKNLMTSWLDTCFSIIKDRCKTHAFGVNAFDLWNKYPFYSSDTTSWLKCSIFYKNNNMTDESKDVKLFKRKKQSDKQRQAYLIKTILDKAKEATLIWEKRGIKWE